MRALALAIAFLTIAAGWHLAGWNRAAAQEPKPARSETTQPAGDSIDELTAALFTMPGDDVAALTRFVRRILEFQPQSDEELRLVRKKAPLALKKATAKILSLEKDQSSAAWRLARSIDLQFKSVEVLGEDGTTEARKRHLDEILKFVQAGNKSLNDFDLAAGYAIDLEYAPARDLASEAYTKFGQLFADSQTEEIAQSAKKMLGAARRLDILGKPLAIKGTTLDGQPFDLASLRGKVVLVDFWATWCEPCLLEMPNVRKNYALYKDKGFEVVAISTDFDRPALEQFVAERKTPWIVLHDKDRDGEHPATIDYGVFKIPCVLLLDKEGKVVSTKAYGDELGRLLKEQLESK